MGVVAKAVVALLLAAAVVSSAEDWLDWSTGHWSDDLTPGDCFCPCMKEQCLNQLDGVTKETCATACDRGCRDAGSPGQRTPDDFCGV